MIFNFVNSINANQRKQIAGVDSKKGTVSGRYVGSDTNVSYRHTKR